MRYRTLGQTDIEVSTIAMGCWAIVGGRTWGDQNKRDAIAAMHAALDAGITFYDTAEGYGKGESEQLLAEGLDNHRDEIVIATKVSPSHFAPADLRNACERSLTNLRTDRIDLYQLHWPNADVPLEDTLATLDSLVDEGKVRSYGVSNFGPRDLSDCLTHSKRVAVDQLAYNLLFRAAEFEIVPLCKDHDISILCYSPLMQGLLTGKFRTLDDVPDGRARTRHYSAQRPQARHDGPGAEKETLEAVQAIASIADGAGLTMAELALAWLLEQPAVTSVLAGARSAEQARCNARAGDVELPADVADALSRATEPLKQTLGPNPDMWESMGTRIH